MVVVSYIERCSGWEIVYPALLRFVVLFVHLHIYVLELTVTLIVAEINKRLFAFVFLRHKQMNSGFSIPVSIAFTVNYVVGAGSLTLPWAFQQAGPILGVIMLVNTLCLCLK